MVCLIILEGIKRQTFKRTQNRHIKVNRHVSVEPDKFASSRNKTINAPKNVRYKRSTKVARARKVVERPHVYAISPSTGDPSVVSLSRRGHVEPVWWIMYYALSKGQCTRADWASYLKPRQRLRAVLTSSRHPLVAVVPPPGLGTPGRGFTAWYLSVFFYVFTFSQCLDESEHMIGNENAIEAALVLFS